MARSNNTAPTTRLARTLHNNARERGPAALAALRARLEAREAREARQGE